MATAKQYPQTGNLVGVVPTNRLAVGRGVGTVTRTGDTLVRVRFRAHPERTVACLVRDCAVLEVRA
jgi:hypothetical protein